MTDDLRYPIGRFAPPAAATPEALAGWKRDIAVFPARLREAIADFDDSRLDTPYRDGGWTVRQTVHHLADSHLNAYCRIKLALTEENPVIKPYEEADWAELPDSALPPEASLAILDGLHQRWSALLDALPPERLERTYHHPEQQADTPLWRVLALYAWHGRHHLAHISGLSARMGW